MNKLCIPLCCIAAGIAGYVFALSQPIVPAEATGNGRRSFTMKLKSCEDAFKSAISAGNGTG